MQSVEKFKCRRCGKCCLEAHECGLRGTFVRDATGRPQYKFEGVCDQLEIKDGVATCKVLKSAIEEPERWDARGRKYYVEEFIGRGCELELAGEQNHGK